jgi:hypothetical protein
MHNLQIGQQGQKQPVFLEPKQLCQKCVIHVPVLHSIDPSNPNMIFVQWKKGKRPSTTNRGVALLYKNKVAEEFLKCPGIDEKWEFIHTYFNLKNQPSRCKKLNLQRGSNALYEEVQKQVPDEMEKLFRTWLFVPVPRQEPLNLEKTSGVVTQKSTQTKTIKGTRPKIKFIEKERDPGESHRML